MASTAPKRPEILPKTATTQLTEQTPLITEADTNTNAEKPREAGGNVSRTWRALTWPVIPSVGVLLLCVSLNLTPIIFYLSYFEKTNWSESGFIRLQFIVLVLPDYLQKPLWAPVALSLEEAAFQAVCGRCNGARAIRKSGALDTVARTVLLKCISTGSTTFFALYNAGLGFWLSLALASASITIIFCLSTHIFGSLAEEAQKRKSERDDAV
ncbi:hypothetical protein TruAng_012181 [Truncatella angustata]|nr:hypothetical protein TruAng_012181 [Truncatella angustata]